MTDHITNHALTAREWAARLRGLAEVMVNPNDPYANQDLRECAEFLDTIAKEMKGNERTVQP